MNAASEQIRDFMDSHDLSFHECEIAGGLVFRCSISTEIASYQTVIGALAEMMFVTVQHPLRIPEGARRMMAEATCRMNWGLKFGRFELDFRDGELRFHDSRWIGALQQPDPEVIQTMLMCAMSTADRYLPAVNAIVYANDAPEDAVKRVES